MLQLSESHTCTPMEFLSGVPHVFPSCYQGKASSALFTFEKRNEKRGFLAVKKSFPDVDLQVKMAIF